MDPAKRQQLEETTRYESGKVEDRIFDSWIEGGYFHPDATGSPEENFSIAIPPPNVTGVLHMGHALNGTIQDTLARTRRMQGRNTLWVLGTDHAGIATQSVVEKRLKEEGIDRHELGREKFIERVWEWKAEYNERIVVQFKRLGASCDYERERFTLDEGYVEAVYKVFKGLHDKGYIYRDNYMVNWDPGSRSAISDLEVENREVTDTLYSIDYPVDGEDGRVLTVATVRPETMLGDTAVAVNPDDPRYGDLVGKTCTLPLVGRTLPIIADEHVDIDFGTGALKITPGHDPNDFEIGRKHGLEEISVIAEDGRMSAAAGPDYEGLTGPEANAKIVEALRAEGLLRAEEDYTHSVPFSHRSGQRIEPLISLQWFCAMDELAEPAIEVVESDEVRITPDRWKRVYLDWMREIRPWCVSRQLWWGHQLPVWYCDACEETLVEESEPESCGKCGGELRRDPDVLDTWFSSALWPFATLGWPDETPELAAFYPTSFLTTARDILYLWVARMIMTGLEFPGKVPFRDVYVHSVIQAPDGRRMSKSLGTGIDPLDEIEAHGADAMRFGLLTMSSTQDVRYSPAKIQQGQDLANKMWNASRLVLLGVDENAHPEPRPLTVEDRWILSRLQRAVSSVSEKIEAYDFAHAALEFYDFFWSEFCDWYLEIVKPRLYDSEPELSSTLLYVLKESLALAHPMMPFVTEEIAGFLPGDTPLVISPFPTADQALIDPEAETEVEAAIDLTREIRRWREQSDVAAGSVLGARVTAGAQTPHELVGRLARIEVKTDVGGDAEPVATIGPLELLASDDLDPEQVEARVEEQRAKLRAEVKRGEGKLANKGFVDGAPASVVEAERQKLESYKAQLAELE